MNPEIRASWATEPAFYTAPSPPQMTPKPYQLAEVEYLILRKHGLLGGRVRTQNQGRASKLKGSKES